MTFMNNPWIIGIGTSIISGLLVFLITRKFLSTKENKEYNQRVKTANNEILYSFRPLIVQKSLPDKDIIDSMLLSVSKKYNVFKKDLYNIYSLVDDLINEILSNAFLSSDQKMEFCQLINQIKQSEGDKQEKTHIDYQVDKKTDSSSYFSFVIAAMTGIMALVFSIFTYLLKDNKNLISDTKFVEPFTIIIITISIPIFVLTFTTFFKIFKDKILEADKDKKKIEETTEDKSKKSKSNNVKIGT